MENLLSIALSSVSVGNILLAYFLGICSFLAVSKKMGTGLALCRGVRADHHNPGQLAGVSLSAGPGCAGMSGISGNRPQLPDRHRPDGNGIYAFFRDIIIVRHSTNSDR